MWFFFVFLFLILCSRSHKMSRFLLKLKILKNRVCVHSKCWSSWPVKVQNTIDVFLVTGKGERPGWRLMLSYWNTSTIYEQCDIDVTLNRTNSFTQLLESRSFEKNRLCPNRFWPRNDQTLDQRFSAKIFTFSKMFIFGPKSTTYISPVLYCKNFDLFKNFLCRPKIVHRH